MATVQSNHYHKFDVKASLNATVEAPVETYQIVYTNRDKSKSICGFCILKNLVTDLR